MLSPAFFSYSVTSKFVEQKENMMGPLLFLPLAVLILVYSFGNKQRGKLRRRYQITDFLIFFYAKKSKIKRKY